MIRRGPQHDAHWGGAPSLSHLWMAALLRRVAMVLVNLACVFGMRLGRCSGECHTGATPEALPRRKSDPIKKDPNPAAASSSHRTTIALMPSRTRSVRPSKHKGGLAAAFCESSSAKARSAACRGSRLLKHRDPFLSRLQAAAAHLHKESRTLSQPMRPRIRGPIAPF